MSEGKSFFLFLFPRTTHGAEYRGFSFRYPFEIIHPWPSVDFITGVPWECVHFIPVSELLYMLRYSQSAEKYPLTRITQTSRLGYMYGGPLRGSSLFFFFFSSFLFSPATRVYIIKYYRSVRSIPQRELWLEPIPDYIDGTNAYN